MTADIMAQNLSATLANIPGSLGYLPERECVVATFLEIPADSDAFAHASATATAHGQQTTDQPTAPTADPDATYQAVLAGLPAYGVHLDVLDEVANAHAATMLDGFDSDVAFSHPDAIPYPLAHKAQVEAADLLADMGIAHYTDDGTFHITSEHAQQLRYLVIIDDAELFAEVKRDDSYLYRIFDTLRNDETAITLCPPIAVVVTDGFTTGKDYYALNAGGGMTHINGQIGDIENAAAVRAWSEDHNFAALATTAQIDADEDDGGITAEQAEANAAAIAEFVMRERDTAGVLAPNELHLDCDPHDLDDAQTAQIETAKDVLLHRALYWQDRLISAARSLAVLNGVGTPIDGKDLRVVLETLAYVYSYSPDDNVLAMLADLPAVPLLFGDITDDPHTSEEALRVAGTDDAARIIRIACDTLYQLDLGEAGLPEEIYRTIQINALRHLAMMAAANQDRNEYLNYRDGFLFMCSTLNAQDSPALDTKFLRSAAQMMPPHTMADIREQMLIETSIVAEMLASAAEKHPDGIAYTDIAVDINDTMRAAISNDAD